MNQTEIKKPTRFKKSTDMKRSRTTKDICG